MLRVSVFTLCLLAANLTQAHFIWVKQLPGDDLQHSRVEVSFGESPSPGEAHLVTKIKQTQLLPILRDAKASTPLPLEVQEYPDKKTAAWYFTSKVAGAIGFEATCDYGVLTKDSAAPFRLFYYAKYLTEPKPMPAAQLALDILPTKLQQGWQFQILWQGQPLADTQVTIVTPTGDDLELKTNVQGIATVEQSLAGVIAVRAVYIDKQAGKIGEKEFGSTKHYSTLTLSLPTEKAALKLSASELLAEARDQRAVWKDFPGLRAELIMSDNGVEHQATTTIDADGNVKLKLADGPAHKWLLTYLEMTVQHRLPTVNLKEEVQYTSASENHPLGTKVSLGDGELDSYYRIKDKAIREVNRRMGPGRFTISVIDLYWNKEGHYLPSYFTISTWGKDGILKNTVTQHDRWQRIQNLDLPLAVTQVIAEDQKRRVIELKFNKIELLKE